MEIPPPTLAISSGQGLYLIWQHEHIKRSALPRWNACQRRIGEVLRPLGADAQAKDAARVRVVGTHNDKRPVYSLLPVGEIHEFNRLADRVLPLTQAQLHDIKIQRAARSSQKGLWAPPEGKRARTLLEEASGSHSCENPESTSRHDRGGARWTSSKAPAARLQRSRISDGLSDAPCGATAAALEHAALRRKAGLSRSTMNA